MKKLVFMVSLLTLILVGCSDSSNSTKPVDCTETIYITGGSYGGEGFISTFNDSLYNDYKSLDLPGDDIELYDGKLYIPNYDSKTINVLDIKTEELTTFTTNLQPWRIALSNGKIYITSFLDPGVEVRSLEDNSIIKTISLGGETGKGYEILSNGDEVYVSRLNNSGWSVENPDDIMKIDATTDQIVDSVTVGKQAWDMLIDHNNRLHILNRGIDDPTTNIDDKGSISIVNLNTFDLEESFKLDYQLESFAINSKGEVYITCGDWVNDTEPYGMIMKYNANNSEILNGPDNPFYKSTDIYDGMLDIIVDKDDRVFAAHYNGNFVIYQNDLPIDTLSSNQGIQEMISVKEYSE